MLDALARTAGASLLDVHTDPHHHRTVFTMAGESEELASAVRSLTSVAVATLDLRTHAGAHPRGGVVDVVPFVPLGHAPRSERGGDLRVAVLARDAFADWAAAALSVPCFLYGPLADGRQRSLPEVRRAAFDSLAPDTGPSEPHPTAGWIAVGARPVLVAYNLWTEGLDIVQARHVARCIRGPHVRALGLQLEEAVQISCNVLDPWEIGPAQLYDAVSRLVTAKGARVRRGELVGLLPKEVLDAIPSDRWAQLGLSDQSTIEARLARGPVGSGR